MFGGLVKWKYYHYKVEYDHCKVGILPLVLVEIPPIASGNIFTMKSSGNAPTCCCYTCLFLYC